MRACSTPFTTGASCPRTCAPWVARYRPFTVKAMIPHRQRKPRKPWRLSEEAIPRLKPRLAAERTNDLGRSDSEPQSPMRPAPPRRDTLEASSHFVKEIENGPSPHWLWAFKYSRGDLRTNFSQSRC